MDYTKHEYFSAFYGYSFGEYQVVCVSTRAHDWLICEYTTLGTSIWTTEYMSTLLRVHVYEVIYCVYMSTCVHRHSACEYIRVLAH